MIRARDLALEAAQLKSHFLSTVSHELRTPLNGIIGMSELLTVMPLTFEQRTCADTIEQSSRVLLRLVNDILDFSKAANGQLRFEEISFSPREVIRLAMAMYSALAESKGLELVSFIEPAVPGNLIGDPYRLGQVLTNLLNNAIKFMHSGSITVRALQEKLSDESMVVRFEVQDTGIGIGLADQDRVFHPFVQADGSTTRQYGGTGLGLAICARLVNLINGEIRVLSTPGRGSVFHFTARFALAHEHCDRSRGGALQETQEPSVAAVEYVASANLADHPYKERVRILIVEDNVTNQLVLRLQLNKLGYLQVTTTENGREALETLGGAPYDIILMDCEMPVMGGVEAARLIRNRKREEKRPYIIAVTGKATPEDRAKCLAAGMDDHISKPIRLGDLGGAIERCFSRPGFGSDGRGTMSKTGG
jgi:CheY-like chemotaxis protein